MKLHNKIDILTLVAVLILSLGFGACSMVEDSPTACPTTLSSPTDSIMLSFKVISHNIGTRADIQDHNEIDSSWPQFEDLIDVNDFAFFIFLDNVPNRPLVMKMTEIGKSTDPNSMITGAYGAYIVTTVIPKTNLEKLLGYELSPGSEIPVKFRMVLLANTKRVKGATFDYNVLAPITPLTSEMEDLSDVTTFEQFMEKANEISYNLNDSFYSRIYNDAEVDGLYKEAIPMFGMIIATTTEDALYTSRPEERIHLGNVNMLRSVAKIQVIDNAEKDDNGYPYIVSVNVQGVTNMAYQLPENASSYSNGQQVHSIRYNSPSDASTDNNSTFFLGYNGTVNNHAKGTVRFGYLPEQSIAFERPMIQITAQLDANRSEVYAVPMSGNLDYPALDFGDAILRNHIYTLSVNSITVGIPAELDVEVEEWIDHPLELSYTETVTVNPRIEWTDGTYFNVNNTNGYVYVRPWSGDNPVLLQCSFKIRTPENARWTAYLIPKEGLTNDAFQFTDKDGNDPTPYVSGIVTNNTELTYLYIKPTIQAPTELNSSILQVVVTLGNGTTIEVPLTPSNRDYKNFTIVQNPQQ